MKRRDRFWLCRILEISSIFIIYTIISLYNIMQINASFIKDEIKELDVYTNQTKWAITKILQDNDFEELKEYSSSYENYKGFSFKVFDENKNLIVSTTDDKISESAVIDKKIKIAKYNILELYRHSFKYKIIKRTSEIYVNNKKYYIENSISQNHVIKSITDAQEKIIILFVSFFIILLISVIKIFFSIRHSFNSLEDSVVKIAQGELDTKIKIPQNGLLEELAQSVSSMKEKLKIQIERLKKLEEYKTEFFQNFTHEIKTPITAINISIELIEEQNNIDEANKECLDIIKFQINSINKLVNDVLVLSEINIQKIDEIKNFQDINLSYVIQEVIEYQGKIDCKINLIKQEDIIIKANREFLIMAISNLLANAIKYSKSDNIDIILKKDDNIVTIEVKDYGIGIEEKHLSRIFEKFYRVDKSRSRQKGGTGLGLSIVKNIVELHNWQIEVTSEIGKGTSFKIII